MDNKGLELTLTSVNLSIPKKVHWTTTFIYSTNKNTIKHLYGKMVDVKDEAGNVIGQREDDDVQNGWYIGHGIKDIYYYGPESGSWEKKRKLKNMGNNRETPNYWI